MTNAIVEKLRTHLVSPIDTECKVVYLLCEIRKLLEAHRHDVRWFTLRLHCHWALHVFLVFPSTTLPFLRKVDKYIANTLDTASATIVVDREGNIINCEVPKLDPVFEDFSYLGTFRKELEEFLALHGLPKMLCDDDTCWSNFLAAYAAVIEVGSLECKPARGLKHVQKVTFTKGHPTENGHLPFNVRWTILLKDGTTLDIEAGAPPSLKGMWWTRRFRKASA